MIRRIVLCLPLMLSLWAARAQAAKVVIVRPASPAPELNETLSRLQGELLSLGLAVAVSERPPASGTTTGTTTGTNAIDSRGWVERLAADQQTDAVIDLIGPTAPDGADIWVFQGRPRHAEVSRVALEPDADNPAQRLAIRSVEVLRSTLVELDLAARGRPPTPPREPAATITQSASSAPADPGGAVDVQIGAALLTGADGVGAALMPVIGAGLTARSAAGYWIAVEGALAGFGSRPTVASAAGSARVAQQYAVAGGRACARWSRALQPCVALGAGVLRTAVEGQTQAPDLAHDVAQWSFVLDASLGARLRLSDSYDVSVAAHLQVAEPYVAIHLADTVVATSGRPNLLFTVTVGAWL